MELPFIKTSKDMKDKIFWIALIVLAIIGVVLALRGGFLGILIFSVIYGLVMNIIPDEKTK